MSYLEQEASSRGLKDKTITTLRDEDYETMESLQKLTLSDMEYMQITRAQQGVLKDWIDDLNARKYSSYMTVFVGGKDEATPTEVTKETVTVTKKVYIGKCDHNADDPADDHQNFTYPANPASLHGFEDDALKVGDYHRIPEQEMDQTAALSTDEVTQSENTVAAQEIEAAAPQAIPAQPVEVPDIYLNVHINTPIIPRSKVASKSRTKHPVKKSPGHKSKSSKSKKTKSNKQVHHKSLCHSHCH